MKSYGGKMSLQMRLKIRPVILWLYTRNCSLVILNNRVMLLLPFGCPYLIIEPAGIKISKTKFPLRAKEQSLLSSTYVGTYVRSIGILLFFPNGASNQPSNHPCLFSSQLFCSDPLNKVTVWEKNKWKKAPLPWNPSRWYRFYVIDTLHKRVSMHPPDVRCVLR